MTEQQWEPGQAAWNSEKGNMLACVGPYGDLYWRTGGGEVLHMAEVGALDPLVRKSEADAARDAAYQQGVTDGRAQVLVNVQQRDAVLAKVRAACEKWTSSRSVDPWNLTGDVLAILDGTDQ